MRFIDRVLIPACFAILAFSLSCSDSTAPEEPVEALHPLMELGGVVSLPQSWPGDLSELALVCGVEESPCGADGGFSLLCLADMQQLCALTGTEGDPILLAWLSEARTEVSVRSTAEVLAWYALGAWWLPSSARDYIREALMGDELDLSDLEAAIAAEILANPDGFTVESASVKLALENLVAGVARSARAGDRGVDVWPTESLSGIDVLNQGGVNAVTIPNTYRRRGIAFLWRDSWEDEDGIEHDFDVSAPDSMFEIPPASGFSGLFGSIVEIIMGNMAYEPNVMEPLRLPHMPDALSTTHSLNVLGFGRNPAADPGLYTSEELYQGEIMAMRTLVQDYFLPMILSFAGATVGESSLDEVLGEDGVGGQLLDYLTLVGTELPAFKTAVVDDGDWWGGLAILWNACLTNGTVSEWTYGLLLDILEELRFTAAETLKIKGAIESMFKVTGLVDVVGGLVDAIITGAHFDDCQRADTWEIVVTAPVLHIEPREATIDAYGTESLTLVIDDDTSTAPDGSSWAYRWYCAGSTGHLVDPVNPTDTGNDFLTSSDEVDFVADEGIAGIETIHCELHVMLGADTTWVGETEMELEVITHEIVLPDTLKVCPGGSIELNPTLDPPYGSETILWDWRCNGSAGELTGPSGQVNEWTGASESFAEYSGLPAGGEDRLVCIASIDYGSFVSAVDTAVVVVDVAPQEMVYGATHLEIFYHDAGCSFRVYIRFPKVGGATHYSIYGHSFYDPAYYGDSYHGSWPGGPSTSFETDTEVFIGLTSGGTTGCSDEWLAENTAWALGRFAGAVWEITPVCP